LTALNQIDIVHKSGSKACIVDAAASALNKIFLHIAKEEGITVINIVRKDT
jgi:hypothetical protein